MKKTDGRFRHTGRRLSIFLYATMLIFNLSLIFSNDTLADITEELKECAAKKDKDEKLECYENLAKRYEPVKAAAAAENLKGSKPDKISMMEKLWDLNKDTRKDAPMIQWYNPNYFLFAGYNTTPNRDTMLDFDPRAKAQNTEAIFQLSGKVRLLPDAILDKLGDTLRDHLDLWAGYTQISFWQLWNSPFSSPFRDTNYAPEGFFTYRTNYDLFGLNMLDLRIINAGFVHQSNGRARPLSRSWNRLFAEFGFEKVFDREQKRGRNEFDLFVKSWYRIPENGQDDDNPDIENYMGYGEIQGIYYWHRLRFGLMLRNNLRASNNKGALQFDFSIPIWSAPFSLYFQYFNGYGESLLDYNSSSNRFSLGFMITNW